MELKHEAGAVHHTFGVSMSENLANALTGEAQGRGLGTQGRSRLLREIVADYLRSTGRESWMFRKRIAGVWRVYTVKREDIAEILALDDTAVEIIT